MSRSHQKGGDPSNRMLRVGELVRHAMSELLSRGYVADPVLNGHTITVPRVSMSADLKCANILVLPLGGKDSADVLAALERHRKAFRAEVARRVNLKFAPDLRFRLDDSFDNAAEIDALLNSPKVRQDLSDPYDPPITQTPPMPPKGTTH